MTQLVFNMSGMDGLIPNFWGELSTANSTSDFNKKIIAGDAQMAHGFYNPLRNVGYLSPTTITSASVAFVSEHSASDIYGSVYVRSKPSSTNTDVYFGERGRRLVMIQSAESFTREQRVIKDLGATGSPVIMDVTKYIIAGVENLFYTYKKGGNVEIGTVPIASLDSDPTTATFNDTWLSVTVANPLASQGILDEAFLTVADNGLAYLCMDNQVHEIDGNTNSGANGKVTDNVLLFPSFFRITDSVSTRGLTFFSIHEYSNPTRGTNITQINSSTESVGVYIWDRGVTTANMRDYVRIPELKQIRSIFVTQDNTVGVIGVSNFGHTLIMEYNGSSFKTVMNLGLDLNSNGKFPVFRHSVTQIPEGTLFLGNDNILYLIHKSSKSLGVTTIKPKGSATANGALGLVNTGTTNTLYIAEIVTTPQVQEYPLFRSTTVTAKQSQGDIYTPVKYIAPMSTVKDLFVYMFPNSGSGTTVAGTIKIYFNQSSTASFTKTITRDDVARGYVYFTNLNKSYVNSVQLEVEYPTSVDLGVSEFNPSLAIINYDETETRG